MADFFNKELLSMYVITLKLTEIVHTTLLKRQSYLPLISNSLTLYESDPKLEPVSLAPPLPLSLRSSWIISIHEKLDQAGRYEPSSHLSIYRVPKPLRDVDESAYTPRIVSLGPYHRGLQHLQDMDHHKWRAVRHALFRKGHDLTLYLDAARSIEGRARAFYEGPLSISTDAFVESLVLDSIFVIELFCGIAWGFSSLGYAPNDPVFCRKSTIISLQRDMLKLENQLPMFVLDRILALHLGYEPCTSDLVASLALNFFEASSPSNEIVLFSLRFDPLDIVGSHKALHCLDLYHRRVLLEGPKPTSRRRQIKRPHVNVHCITKLREAGIKFRRYKSDRFWDIRFKDGVLHIPHLYIQYGTKSIFLNLIAFEQCHSECSHHIISYIMLMDDLINTEVDVGYLNSEGIIKNCLGTNGEVANLFNKLGQEVVFNENDYYFSELAEQVNHHCNRRWNAWRASLIHKYLSNPWTITSLIAAVVLLLLTFGQTFYSIFGYYKPI